MALAVAEKLRHNLAAEDLALAPGLTTRVTASLGVAELQAGESVVQGITRADQALYAAKHGGRDRVQAAPMPAQVA
jgi:diguanylate cyclase (GGDEF)-like protein